MVSWPRKNKHVHIYIISASAVLILLVLGLVAWRLGWFSPASAVVQIGLPGSSDETSVALRVSQADAVDLESKMVKLLTEDESDLLALYYRQEGQYGLVPDEQSAILVALDQLLYGQYLIEQGRRTSFEDWWADYIAVFQTDDGFFKTDMNGPEGFTDDDWWRVNLTTLRVLAQSVAVWPDHARQTMMQNLSDELLDLAGSSIAPDADAAVPTTAPITDFAATPTPKPSVTQAAPAPSSVPVLRLATLDLYLMQQMSVLDSRWQILYDRYLQVVQDGYISDDLPLFAYGYSVDSGAYVNYSGVTPNLDVEESLLVLLHLCEVGAGNDLSINWLRSQLLNNGAIYERYHIALGTSADSSECIPAYAIAARIARIIGDQTLYDAAVDRLLWHQATSLTSTVRYAIFREDDQQQIFIYSWDNAWAFAGIALNMHGVYDVSITGL